MKRKYTKGCKRDNPKILFIGPASSTHTEAWLALLDDLEFNVRLFSTPDYHPRPEFNVFTYVVWSISSVEKTNNLRRYLYKRTIPGRLKFYFDEIIDRLMIHLGLNGQDRSEAWLAKIIKKWKPDIIHTFGIFDGHGGLFYYNVRKRYHIEEIGKWILQLRGGSDLTLRKNEPQQIPLIKDILLESDQILSDNCINIQYATELGILREKFASIVPVPGTGGIEIDQNCKRKLLNPSQRQRIILCPKFYESKWSKALPILEALKLALNDILPCKIYLLSTTPDVQEWIYSLPEDLRKICFVYERIPREEVFQLIRSSRIVLAPSLIDGIPNILYESMANGSFPIVSPLETIKTVVKEPENVLFARNLYPYEISRAIIKAMKDDALVDKAAQNNFSLVKKVANRTEIRKQVVDNYKQIIKK